MYRHRFDTVIRGLSTDFKVLSVSGIYCDSIKAVHPSSGTGLSEWMSVMFDSSEQLRKLYRPTEESLERALRRVLLLDTTAFFGRNELTRWQPDSHDRFEDIANTLLSNEEARIASGKLSYAIDKNSYGRLIFVTREGKLGMAANTVQPGDIIALLLGGDMPMVLRRTEDTDHYTLVADCYLHGYMDGKGLIDARRAADPTWSSGDRTWLDELHNGELPFPVTDFHIHRGKELSCHTDLGWILRGDLTIYHRRSVE